MVTKKIHIKRGGFQIEMAYVMVPKHLIAGDNLRPELGRVLAPADNTEDDISESRLELREGLWVVWVLSMLTVGEALL